ncbi:MAG: DNA-directed RNA polymerase [Candidatus Aenigmarchaeota archaeon]|nr:DNA-directed RNA polymerase [Candidatus Aenigmarchaeota archaeon]
MYQLATVEERIRVPPEKLGMSVKDAIVESATEKFVGLIDKRLGIMLAIISVEEIKEGRIIAGDAGVHYNCVLKLLTYKPELHEIVRGEVIDNTEFGSFVRIGPIDGLVHISQLMDDFVSYDSKNSVFLGKQTKQTLKEKDLVVARLISSSLGKEENKISLTMRQEGLGATHWIEEKKRKAKKG